MSRPSVGRSYSFDPDDETSLRAHQQDHDPQYLPYRDNSPVRSTSPPGYASSPYQAYRRPSNAPPPPVHRQPASVDPFADSQAGEYDNGHELGYRHSTRTASTTTPGMDNMGETSAGGGIAGIALGVAGNNERESGLQAMRGISPERYEDSSFDRSIGVENPYIPEPHSRVPLGHYSTAAPVGAHTPGWVSPASQHEGAMPMDHYPALPVDADSPYKRYSAPWDARVDRLDFDPNDIEDDGDDGLMHPHNRRPMMGFGGHSKDSLARGGAGGAAAGVIAGEFAANNGSGVIMEKKGHMAAAARRRKRKRVLFIALGALAFLGIVAGAVVGGVLGSKKAAPSNSLGNGGADDGSDFMKNSPDVQALLNNAALKKVFPGMDYTPFNAQYPACLTNPPSQNNVTMDMAVLSQLTNTVRLYGTDCNQTEMVIEAFNRLGLTNMKIWLGVWLDNNATTNARGMSAMYDILNEQEASRFAGVIIGNEVLFRNDMTPAQLGEVVAGVRSNFTAKKIDLPIGVADLGDNWQKDGAAFIQSVDVVMSNIHPFFGGVEVSAAAGWTWNFWQNNDIGLTAGTAKKNVISEVGWPSAGGNDCGTATTKCPNPTAGAVAGIDEMNTFMDTFVCQSLANQTNYFWFEAFDEPWKVQFNTPGEEWEDKWGLMTPDRKIKPGLVIPSCNGQTVD